MWLIISPLRRAGVVAQKISAMWLSGWCGDLTGGGCCKAAEECGILSGDRGVRWQYFYWCGESSGPTLGNPVCRLPGLSSTPHAELSSPMGTSEQHQQLPSAFELPPASTSLINTAAPRESRYPRKHTYNNIAHNFLPSQQSKWTSGECWRVAAVTWAQLQLAA